MMNSFSTYMNKIKAEDELKAKTKDFVKKALANNGNQIIDLDLARPAKQKKSAVKKLIAAASALAACIVLSITGYAVYHTPVNYISVDINPSVELGINLFDTVISVQSFNDDGYLLLKDHQYTNLSVQEAVNQLIQEAAQNGFIAENGSTVIALTAESNNDRTASKLVYAGGDGVNAALCSAGIDAVLYTDCTNIELRNEASDAGLSPGKYKLIEILMALDPSITIEEYRYEKITSIMSKINELLDSDAYSEDQLAQYSADLGSINDTAQRVQQAIRNAEMEQNRYSEENQDSGAGEQVTNQNQNTSEPRQENNQSQVSPGAGQGQNQGSDDTPSPQGQQQNQGSTDSGQGKIQS